jgi:YVTN family beta-propeller protein
VPVAKAVSADGRTVWVANHRARQVLALDARTRRVRARITVANEPVGVTPDGVGGVWVTVRDPSGLAPDVAMHYDGRGGLLAQLPFAYGIAALVVRPHALWIAARKLSRVVRVDPGNGHVGGFAEIVRPARALAWGAGHLWATSPDDNALAKIDPKTYTAGTQTVGPFPMQIAVTGGRVFVACLNDQSLVVVDPRTMRRVKRLPMPLNPFAVTADARHVWVTSLGENAVVRVDVG